MQYSKKIKYKYNNKNMNLGNSCIAKSIIVLTVIICTFQSSISIKKIEINKQLKELQKDNLILQDKRIDLKINEVFMIESNLLQPIYVTQKQCHSHQGALVIQQVDQLSIYNHANKLNYKQSNQTFQGAIINHFIKDSIEDQFLYNTKYQIIYRVRINGVQAYKLMKKSIEDDTYSYKILQEQSVHSFAQNIDYQNKHKLQHIAQMQLISNNSSSCARKSIFSKNNQYLYVFSCQKIIKIYCSRILSYYETIYQFNHNNSKDTIFNGFELYYFSQYVFWISQYSVRIYQVQVDGNLTLTDTVSLEELNNKQKSTASQQISTQSQITTKQYTISSVQYHKGLLYILTLKQGILIYERVGNFHFRYINQIQYQVQIQKINHKLLIHNNAMLIQSQSSQSSFITQLQIGSLSPSSSSFPYQYSLVRYYKGYRTINEMIIYQNKLLIVTNRGLELYPIAQDARLISLFNNGISNNHYNQLLSLFFINYNYFIFKQLDFLYLVKLHIQWPKMDCHFTAKGNYKVMIKKQCSQYKNCQKYDNLQFNVTDKAIQSLSLWLISMAITLTILIVFILIRWRESKLDIIDQILSQIRALRIKKLKQLDFEQSTPKKAKQRSWKQLEEQMEQELQYKFSPIQKIQDQPLDNMLMSDRFMFKLDKNLTQQQRKYQQQSYTKYQQQPQSQHQQSQKNEQKQLQNTQKQRFQLIQTTHHF